LGGVIDALNPARENVGLKAVCIQKVVLEELAGLVRLSKSLDGQNTMRSTCQYCQPLLEWSWQVVDIVAITDRGHVLVGIWIRMTRRGRLYLLSESHLIEQGGVAQQ